MGFYHMFISSEIIIAIINFGYYSVPQYGVLYDCRSESKIFRGQRTAEKKRSKLWKMLKKKVQEASANGSHNRHEHTCCYPGTGVFRFPSLSAPP
jgi:hypothetical protein